MLPAHNLPFRGQHDRLDAIAAHHRDRLEVAVEACAEPRTAAELIGAIFPRRAMPYKPPSPSARRWRTPIIWSATAASRANRRPTTGYDSSRHARAG